MFIFPGNSDPQTEYKKDYMNVIFPWMDNGWQNFSLSTQLYKTRDFKSYEFICEPYLCGSDHRIHVIDGQIIVSNYDGYGSQFDIVQNIEDCFNCVQDNVLVGFTMGRNMSLLDYDKNTNTLKLMDWYHAFEGITTVKLTLGEQFRQEYPDSPLKYYESDDCMKRKMIIQFEKDNCFNGSNTPYGPIFSFGTNIVKLDINTYLSMGHIKFHTYEMIETTYQGKLEDFRQQMRVLREYYGVASVTENNPKGYMGHLGSGNENGEKQDIII